MTAASQPLAIAEQIQPESVLRRLYVPMGYPLEIVSESSEVFSIASELWRPFEPLSDAPPIQLRIAVSRAEALSPPAARMPQHFGHLMAIVQSAETFAIADMSDGCGLIHTTQDVVRNADWFAYHLLEPIAYVLLGARHFTILHAACVDLEGKAALLCGDSGAGKTCLAYACAKRGWAFISGDATHLVRASAARTVAGRPFSIRFRASAKAVFKELWAWEPALRPSGKRDLELDTRDLNLTPKVTSEAAVVVFLNRVVQFEPCEPRLDPVPQDDARRTLSESICFGDEKIRREQQDALDRLLDLPLLRLTFSDPFEAEPLLRSAIRGAK